MSMTTYAEKTGTRVLCLVPVGDDANNYLGVYDLAYTPVTLLSVEVWPDDIPDTLAALEAYTAANPKIIVPYGGVNLADWELADSWINKRAYLMRLMAVTSTPPWNTWLEDKDFVTSMDTYVDNLVVGTDSQKITALKDLMADAYFMIVYISRHLNLWYDVSLVLDPIGT
jgi:hypothetical protein